MKLAEFDYNLPKDLIAQYPAKERDASRLLVIDKLKGSVGHGNFSDVLEYLNPGDCLVINDTKVIPARLWGVKENSQTRVEVLLLEQKEKNLYKALIRPGSKLKPGQKILFNGGKLSAQLLSKGAGGAEIKFNANGNLLDILEDIGEVPLPPYIERKPETQDRQRYQTVFAKNKGAIAAPTAGLHFTPELLDKISKKGVNIARLTLHVGYGTFKPVKEEDIENHDIESEHFEISPETAEMLNKTKQNGGRIIAVGTTSTRALETIAGKNGKIIATKEKTNLFIYPGYKFKFVDALLTNFHLPKTTLLMLVCAFAGRDLVFKAYREAVEEKYRFYSYGDAMLII